MSKKFEFIIPIFDHDLYHVEMSNATPLRSIGSVFIKVIGGKLDSKLCTAALSYSSFEDKYKFLRIEEYHGLAKFEEYTLAKALVTLLSTI